MLFGFGSKNELAIEGTPAELKAISDILSKMIRSKHINIDFNQDTNPDPYDFILNGMSIYVTETPIIISVLNNRLILKGSSEALDVFASFWLFDDKVENGTHTHFEYTSESKYIDPKSLPLVISVCLK